MPSKEREQSKLNQRLESDIRNPTPNRRAEMETEYHISRLPSLYKQLNKIRAGCILRLMEIKAL